MKRNKIIKRLSNEAINYEVIIRNYDAEYRKAFEHGAKWGYIKSDLETFFSAFTA